MRDRQERTEPEGIRTENGNYRPRWYLADVLGKGMGRKWPDLEKRGILQTPRGFARHYGQPENSYFTLPEELIRLAQDEYDIQHPGQPYERMQKRGGLGILEMVMLLADALERERYGTYRRRVEGDS